MKQQNNNNQTIAIMNDIFSFSRLWLLLKKDVMENYKMFLVGGLSLFLGITAVLLMFSPIFSLPEVGGMAATFLALYGYYFGCGIAASLMFAQMRTKQGKISLFSLPATTCEKYAEQILVWVIGFAVLFFGSLELGELIRCHVAPLLWGDIKGEGFGDMSTFINYFAYPSISVDNAASPFAALGLSSAKLFWFTLFIALNEIGFFTLGSVLWPKYTYIKMYALSYAINMVLMILVVGIMMIFGVPQSDSIVMILSSNGLIAFEGVLAVAFFVASYWFFKHKDVIR